LGGVEFLKPALRERFQEERSGPPVVEQTKKRKRRPKRTGKELRSRPEKESRSSLLQAKQIEPERKGLGLLGIWACQRLGPGREAGKERDIHAMLPRIEQKKQRGGGEKEKDRGGKL